MKANITQSNPKLSFSLVFGSKFDDRRSKKKKRMSKTGEEAGGGEETRDGIKMLF
jgi:hypothetical protein